MTYYDEHAKEYIEKTMNLDMTEQYQLFEKYLPSTNIKILDIGFGSGRDMVYFKNKGYSVSGIDISNEFVKHALDLGLDVKEQDVLKLDKEKEYDAIWACASLLHLKDLKLRTALKKCYKALKVNGIMYASFKVGVKYKKENDLFYNFMTEIKARNIIKDKNIQIKELAITYSNMENCNDQWINLIIKRVK